jgi:two-component system LytT family response regulator
MPVDEIQMIEAAGNYFYLHFGGNTYVLRRSIGDIAEKLNPAHFLRINRSDIVRPNEVKEFQGWFHGDQKVILKDGTELRWSRRYRARQNLDFAGK